MLRVLASVFIAALLATTANAGTRIEQIKTADRYVYSTWHYQRVMGHNLTPSHFTYRTTKSDEYRSWVVRYWKRVLDRTYREFQNVPYKSAWICIHSGEGAWDDPNAPYYGGLQMDLGFQSHYGNYLLSTKGTADNWTPLEQMWVAYKAARSGRGFYPWPNTARDCGLI